MNITFEVEVTRAYNDAELGRDTVIGDRFTVSLERAMILLNNHVCKITDIYCAGDGDGNTAELQATIDQQRERISQLESYPTEINTMIEYAYMTDAQLQSKAKENGVDGRIKDRKVIIEALIKTKE